MLKTLAITFIFLGSASAWAQQKPKAPYIAPIPKDVHWVMTFRPPGGEKSKTPEAAREVVSVDTVKTDTSRQVTLSFGDGTTERFDQVGSYILTSTDRGPQLRVATEDPPSYPFYSDGYLYAGGVGPDTYVGVETFQGVECFHYKTEANEVWVSTETMLPVATRAEGLTVYFQFLPPPTTPLAFSSEKLALLQKQERAYKAFRDLR